MVELVQYFAKLGEAVQVLWDCRTRWRMHPDAKPLVCLGGSIAFAKVSFSYPNGKRAAGFQSAHSRRPEGRACGPIRRRQVLSLLQRLYDPAGGHLFIDISCGNAQSVGISIRKQATERVETSK